MVEGHAKFSAALLLAISHLVPKHSECVLQFNWI